MVEEKENGIDKEIEIEKEKSIAKNEISKNVVGAEITTEMEKAYIDYAMSVIVSRALPSVEDGLKPVQRRILYSMNLLGLQKSGTKKSARIVGDVLGKFHPHGDQALYGALVRMAQDFSLRYPLIKGQGNFGSIDGDSAAAMRYTEAKLAGISIELLEDLDKETVKLLPNFDNSIKEPEILPGKLPNLLLNGASGIAVGMATNIPPHNLINVADTIIKYIENPKIEVKKLARIIQGPDFPTGGSISGDLEGIYEKGKGRVVIRGKTTIEEKKKKKIVITEIPYMVNKSDLITSIAKLVSDKKLPDISDLRDESSKGKIRIVLELKKQADEKFTINRLYKYTRLQDNFDANIIALVKGQPKQLNLLDIVKEYVDYRKIIVEKRSKFLLKKAESRLEIVDGLIKALKDIDNIIKLIKKSKHSTEALEALVKKGFSKNQSQAILDMKLSSLTNLEQDKLKKEEKELKEKIKELQKILSSEKEILNVIRKEVLELKRKYGDKRRTNIIGEIKEFKEKDLVRKKDVVVMITDKGYIKRMDIKTYKEQRRGGKGVIGTGLSTGDFVKQLLTCSTHDYLMLFTNKGRIYWLRAYDVPAAERYSKGRALINLMNIKDEQISSVLSVKNFEDYLFAVTKKGIVKKIRLSLFSKPRKTGVRFMNIPDGDFVVSVWPVKDKQEVLLATKKGNAVRFSSDAVRSMGRASYGVSGAKLNVSDEIIGLTVLPLEKSNETIFTITEKGYGKRSKIEDYRLTGRGVKGVINLKVSSKTGNVVTTSFVNGNDSIIATTAKGLVIRTSMKNVRVMGRATQGVRIVKLQDSDKVVDMTRVPREEVE